MARIVVHNYLPKRKTRDADQERTGKVVLQGGKWWWRRPNDTVRYGPFSSASEAASAARFAGVSVDTKTRDASPAEIENYYRRLKEMGRKELEKIVGGRLDPSHLRSESKETLVNAALNAKFNRKDLNEWRSK